MKQTASQVLLEQILEDAKNVEQLQIYVQCAISPFKAFMFGAKDVDMADIWSISVNGLKKIKSVHLDVDIDVNMIDLKWSYIYSGQCRCYD